MGFPMSPTSPALRALMPIDLRQVALIGLRHRRDELGTQIAERERETTTSPLSASCPIDLCCRARVQRQYLRPYRRFRIGAVKRGKPRTNRS
jgi:hypothetical protein